MRGISAVCNFSQIASPVRGYAASHGSDRGSTAADAGSRDGFTKRNRFYAVRMKHAVQVQAQSRGPDRQAPRLIQPLFTRKQIAGYAELMAEEATRVATRWERATRKGGDVDANGEMFRLTLRVVGRSIFGDDVERAVPVLDSAFPVLNRRTFPTDRTVRTEGSPRPRSRRQRKGYRRGTGSSRGWNNCRVFASSVQQLNSI